MNRTILILGLVTALVAGAALWATKSRAALTAPGAGTATVEGKLFPQLTERINDVTALTVTGPDGSFTIQREGDAWGAADKGGYPVDFGKVRGLVVGISQFDVVETMTANPDFHDRLGLEAPDAPEAESKRVTLKDSAGTVLADVILGDARTSRGGGQPTLYARRADEDQSYEVTGRLYVDTSESNWLDRKVLELKQERVAGVTITHPDGEVLSISRQSPDETNFTVADLPEGRALVWEGVARSIATAAQSLNLEDVGGSDLFDFSSAEPTTAEFRTFDGLVVTATTAQADDKTYLKVAARAERLPEDTPAEAAGAAADDAEAAPEEADAEPAAEEGEEAADEAFEPEPPARKPFEEVQAEADEINARAEPWIYVIPGWSAANLRKRMDELLKPLEPPGPPPPPAEADGADAGLDLGDEELPEGLEEAIQKALSGAEDGR